MVNKSCLFDDIMKRGGLLFWTTLYTVTASVRVETWRRLWLPVSKCSAPLWCNDISQHFEASRENCYLRAPPPPVSPRFVSPILSITSSHDLISVRPYAGAQYLRRQHRNTHFRLLYKAAKRGVRLQRIPIRCRSELWCDMWTQRTGRHSHDCIHALVDCISHFQVRFVLTLIPATGRGREMTHQCAFCRKSPSKQWNKTAVFMTL